ncbi:MAG: SPASM domain-containing protein [Desulfobacterales bacterium]|nr:SPASM domain-containing protein [Desulfobacterales bacterium]
MEESLYLKVLNELAQVNYNNKISFSRYNEPLADKIILKRLNQARNLLPDATLHTNTNGDYLDLEYLRALYLNGLNSLFIQVYLDKYDDKSAEIQMIKIINKLNLPYKIIKNMPNKRLEAVIYYENMNIRIYSRNFEADGSNRAGLVSNLDPEYERIAPCLAPFYHIYIDYNGNATPCCSIRSDSTEHKNYSTGNIKDYTIFELYASSPLIEWRKNLINYGKKTPPLRFL